jgi:hypothetical protein
LARWLQLVRSLGEALLEVLRAELAALQGDVQRSGRHLGIGLALLGGAAMLAFWAVGLVVFVLITLLALWLPLWGAALVVLALFLIGTAILALLGKKRLMEVENPVSSVRRRLDDHLAWWQESFLAPEGALEGEAEGPLGALDDYEDEEYDR